MDCLASPSCGHHSNLPGSSNVRGRPTFFPQVCSRQQSRMYGLQLAPITAGEVSEADSHSFQARPDSLLSTTAHFPKILGLRLIALGACSSRHQPSCVSWTSILSGSGAVLYISWNRAVLNLTAFLPHEIRIEGLIQ